MGINFLKTNHGIFQALNLVTVFFSKGIFSKKIMPSGHVFWGEKNLNQKKNKKDPSRKGN